MSKVLQFWLMAANTEKWATDSGLWRETLKKSSSLFFAWVSNTIGFLSSLRTQKEGII